MNIQFRYLAIIIAVLLLGCHKKDSETLELRIGKDTEINSGQTAVNSKYNIQLTVEDIEDSRCPKDVLCIWEGNGVVNFLLEINNNPIKFHLDTNKNHPDFNFINDTIIGDFRYELKDIQPYPISFPPPSNQRAIVLVTKK